MCEALFIRTHTKVKQRDNEQFKCVFVFFFSHDVNGIGF